MSRTRATVDREAVGDAPSGTAVALAGAGPRATVLALQRSAGNAAVTRLLQRRVLVGRPGSERELFGTRQQRQEYLAGRSMGGSSPALAERVLEDMASSGEAMHFASAAELEQELIQRVSASGLMRESQDHRHGRAFGYPYRGRHRLYGPRVNFAARDFWDARDDELGNGNAVTVDYSDRSHNASARRVVDTAADDAARAAALHDPPPTYSFVLNERGRANPFLALRALFEPQPPERRTLIHCDYLVSIVQMLSFAQALGSTEFNRRLALGQIGRTLESGERALVLRPFGFDDINVGDYVPPGQGHPEGGRGWQFPAAGGQALMTVQPSRVEDLVIGDHVRFFNHPAYMPLTLGAGEWQLENAILVDRRHGHDRFLGHGSGEATEREMRERLLERYNGHVREALRHVRTAESSPGPERAGAEAWLRARFVRRHLDGHWYVDTVETGDPRRRAPVWRVVQELRELRVDEIPGLYQPFSYQGPADPGTLSPVRRPIAARDYPAEDAPPRTPSRTARE